MSVLSIIVPCYNEEESIHFFYEAMKELEQDLPGLEMEYLFIDDGSKDKTYEKLSELHERDNRVKCISFSRNFGKEAAIFSGLRAANGDCVVVMDADLQHPPKTIVEMVAKWREGYEVVEGIKTNRGRESVFHKLFANSFYNIMSKLIGVNMNNTSDFKLLDRKVVKILSGLHEKDTFFRALSYWVGFKTTSVHYEVQERVAGTTKWSFTSLLRYAVKNIIAFSYAPLKLISVLGFLILGFGVALGVDAIVSYLRGTAQSGYPTIICMIVLATGGIMLSLGIVGTYIAKIYEQVKDRPQYIIGDRKD
ncbi:MAG: glycosyltransferase family 2 protein [Lachnospiraceae bacterium]|nr:glycosyltransferase family 2 protein [Lachnospiraceae bacterium]